MFMSSPVLGADLLIGLSPKQKGQVFCLDPATGKTLWKSAGRMGDNAALLNAGSVLILLTTEADLIFLKPDARELVPLAKYRVASSPTWAHPAVSGSRILVKDRDSLASFQLMADG